MSETGAMAPVVRWRRAGPDEQPKGTTMSKSSPKLPTPKELEFYRSKIATGSYIGSRQLAAVFVALDDANARAEAAEKRVRDMEAVTKVTLSEEALAVGFMDGLNTVISYLRGACAESDCSADERATITGVAKAFEKHKKKLIDTYRADTAPKRTGTIRIKPV